MKKPLFRGNVNRRMRELGEKDSEGEIGCEGCREECRVNGGTWNDIYFLLTFSKQFIE